MSRTTLWAIAIVLTVGALVVLLVVIPGRQSYLARHGVRGYGTCVMKDDRPSDNGGVVHIATLEWQDDQKKNHRRDVVVYDDGVWDDLKANKDIRVFYLPNNPDVGSIPGAEDMTTPKASALKFVAWTALFIGIGVGVKAWLTPRSGPAPGQPVVTRR